MVWRLSDVDAAFDRQSDLASRLIDIEFDVGLWALTNLNISLFDNQIEIVESIVDFNTKYITLVATRSAGKSFATAVGIVKLCIDNPGFTVGIFAPKLEQATRLLKACNDILKNSNVLDEINWTTTTKSRLEFANGSWIVGQSANEISMTEGLHVDMVCLDESQKISDLSISQKILPMLAASRTGRIIKLGVALYKNHFWRSFNDQQYKHLIFDWTRCPNLLKGGSVIVRGKEYSKYVIDRMPLNIKQQIFPENPELWINTTDTTETDFRTQYLIEWQDSLDQVLSESDQRILASGNHRWLPAGLVTDTYFAGLDTASGSASGNTSGDLDFTSLAIWRKNNLQIKEKVFHAEWRGDITQAINEIYELINPQTGKFRCQFTLVDYSNVGISLVESYKNLGVPIEGVTFGSTERSSGKNLKNAMMDQFLFELRAGRVVYPGADIDKIKMLKKCQTEWHLMERHRGLGINDKLCLSGSTIIPLLNGVHISIEELAEKKLQEPVEVLSIDPKTRTFRVGTVSNIFSNGVKSVVRVHLSNGTFFDCTLDHKILLNNGKYQEAGKLTPKSQLMASSLRSFKSDKTKPVVVTGIEQRSDPVAVYDLTVPKWNNFALDCGVFAHNCVPESDGHDDSVSADMLALWAADKNSTFLKGNAVSMTLQLPMPINVNSVLNPTMNGSTKPWWVSRDFGS